MVRRALERQLAAVADGNGGAACALATPAGQASLAAAVPGSTCEHAISVLSANLPSKLKAALRSVQVKKVDVSGENAIVRYTVATGARANLRGFFAPGPAPTTLKKQPNGRWKISSAPSGLLCPPASGSGMPDASALISIADRYRPPPDALLACVGQQPILGGELSHWLQIAEIGSKLSGTASVNTPRSLMPGSMDFLIKARWYIAEASALHITVTGVDVRRRLEQDRRAQFSQERKYKAFLKEVGETVADIQFRVRVSLLAERLGARFHVTGTGLAPVQRLNHDVGATWKVLTYCRRAYTVAGDCGHPLGSR